METAADIALAETAREAKLRGSHLAIPAFTFGLRKLEKSASVESIATELEELLLHSRVVTTAEFSSVDGLPAASSESPAASLGAVTVGDGPSPYDGEVEDGDGSQSLQHRGVSASDRGAAAGTVIRRSVGGEDVPRILDAEWHGGEDRLDCGGVVGERLSQQQRKRNRVYAICQGQQVTGKTATGKQDNDSDSGVGPKPIRGGASSSSSDESEPETELGGDGAANLLLGFKQADRRTVYSVHRFVTSIPRSLGMHIRLEQQHSVLVTSVEPNSTAFRLGVKKDDVITQLLETTDPKQMYDALISVSNNDALISASNMRPLTFEVKRRHILEMTEIPSASALHRFVICDFGQIGANLGRISGNQCVVNRVVPEGLAEFYGMRQNDMLARPGTDGEVCEGVFDEIIDGIIRGERPIVIEAWRDILGGGGGVNHAAPGGREQVSEAFSIAVAVDFLISLHGGGLLLSMRCRPSPAFSRKNAVDTPAQLPSISPANDDLSSGNGGGACDEERLDVEEGPSGRDSTATKKLLRSSRAASADSTVTKKPRRSSRFASAQPSCTPATSEEIASKIAVKTPSHGRYKGHKQTQAHSTGRDMTSSSSANEIGHFDSYTNPHPTPAKDHDMDEDRRQFDHGANNPLTSDRQLQNNKDGDSVSRPYSPASSGSGFGDGSSDIDFENSDDPPIEPPIEPLVEPPAELPVEPSAGNDVGLEEQLVEEDPVLMIDDVRPPKKSAKESISGAAAEPPMRILEAGSVNKTAAAAGMVARHDDPMRDSLTLFLDRLRREAGNRGREDSIIDEEKAGQLLAVTSNNADLASTLYWDADPQIDQSNAAASEPPNVAEDSKPSAGHRSQQQGEEEDGSNKKRMPVKFMREGESSSMDGDEDDDEVNDDIETTDHKPKIDDNVEVPSKSTVMSSKSTAKSSKIAKKKDSTNAVSKKGPKRRKIVIDNNESGATAERVMEDETSRQNNRGGDLPQRNALLKAATKKEHQDAMDEKYCNEDAEYLSTIETDVKAAWSTLKASFGKWTPFSHDLLAVLPLWGIYFIWLPSGLILFGKAEADECIYGWQSCPLLNRIKAHLQLLQQHELDGTQLLILPVFTDEMRMRLAIVEELIHMSIHEHAGSNNMGVISTEEAVIDGDTIEKEVAPMAQKCLTIAEKRFTIDCHRERVVVDVNEELKLDEKPHRKSELHKNLKEYKGRKTLPTLPLRQYDRQVYPSSDPGTECAETTGKRKRQNPRQKTISKQEAKAKARADFTRKERSHFSNSRKCDGFKAGTWLKWTKFGLRLLANGWLPHYGYYIVKLPNGSFKRGVALPHKDMSNFIKNSCEKSCLQSRVRAHLSGLTSKQLNKAAVKVFPAFSEEECKRVRIVETAVLFMVFTHDKELLDETLTKECGTLSGDLLSRLETIVKAFIEGKDPTVKFGKRQMPLSQFQKHSQWKQYKDLHRGGNTQRQKIKDATEARCSEFNKLSDIEKVEAIAKENKRRKDDGKAKLHHCNTTDVHCEFLRKLKRNWSSFPSDVRIKMIRIGYNYELGAAMSTENRDAKFTKLVTSLKEHLANNNYEIPPMTSKSELGKGKYAHIIGGTELAVLCYSLFCFKTSYLADKGGWTSNANAARLSLLGIRGLFRKGKKGKKKTGDDEYVFLQPGGKVAEIVLQEQVQSILDDYNLIPIDDIKCKVRVILLGHLLTLGLDVGQHDAEAPAQVVDLANDLKLQDISVKWKIEDGEGNGGHAWYDAVVQSPTIESYHEIAVGGCMIKLPVYHVIYPGEENPVKVVFLSDTCLQEIDENKEPFYEFSHSQGQPLYDMQSPFDYEVSLKCKNETEMKRYVGRCIQATLRGMDVAVAEANQAEFVGKIEDMVHQVVDGLDQLRHSKRKGPKNAQGDFGLKTEGTTTVTADEIIEILKANN